MELIIMSIEIELIIYVPKEGIGSEAKAPSTILKYF